MNPSIKSTGEVMSVIATEGDSEGVFAVKTKVGFKWCKRASRVNEDQQVVLMRGQEPLKLGVLSKRLRTVSFDDGTGMVVPEKNASTEELVPVDDVLVKLTVVRGDGAIFVVSSEVGLPVKIGDSVVVKDEDVAISHYSQSLPGRLAIMTALENGMATVRLSGSQEERFVLLAPSLLGSSPGITDVVVRLDFTGSVITEYVRPVSS
jgi:hypothetical protein